MTLALFVCWALQADLSKIVERLNSTDLKEVEQARHDLIDFADDAVKPLQAFLEKNPTGRAAEQAKLVLQALEVRKKLTERIILSYPYVEENLAASGRDAAFHLLQRMTQDHDRNSLSPADFQAVLLLLLSYPNLTDEIKKSVVETAAAQRLKDCADQIAPLIGDPNAELAEQAAVTLVQIGSNKQGPVVARLLEDSSPVVKARAVKVLGHLKYKEASDAVAKLLDDPSPGVRSRAIGTLAIFGAKKLAPELVKKLKDDDADVRETAAAALVELGASDQIPEISKLLDAGPLRMLALKLLAHLGDPSAAPAILPLLDQDSKELKAAAIVALGRIHAVEADGRLIKILRDDAAFRDEAATALSNLLADTSILPLVALLRHETIEVRRAAQDILKRYRGEALAKALRGTPAEAARDLAILIGASRQSDAVAELRAMASKKDPLAVVTLAEFADASIKAQAIELAAAEGPWQLDALVALNAYSSRSLYAEANSAGFREWEFKTTVEKALDELGVRVIVSDRLPKETREAAFEYKRVAPARDVLVELSRRFKIGFVFEKSEVRAVPLDEAIAGWKK
jgi:HEAT repeat protein